MKIGILGDTHIGARNDSQVFQDYFRKFYSEHFFPKLEEYNVEKVIQLGDLFDKRKNQNTNTFYTFRKEFFERFAELNIDLYTFPGNHDTYFKSTNTVNALTEFVKGNFDNVYVIEDLDILQFGSTQFGIVPWINQENHDESVQTIKNFKNNVDVIFGHFEITGFRMMQGGIVCDDGLSPDLFDGFEYVFSGHFHHPSKKGNITYVGSPYELMWGDEGDEKGFIIFDTETQDYEWIPTPYTIHKKIFYDDVNDVAWNNLQDYDFTEHEGKKIKVVVINKEDEKLFDTFVQKFQELNLVDFQVQDAIQGYNNTAVEIGETEDTITTLKRNIHAVSDNRIDNNTLDTLAESVYNEALNEVQTGE